MKRLGIAVIALAAVGGAAAFWLSRDTSEHAGHTAAEHQAAQEQAATAGPRIRDLPLTDASGQKVTLASYQGKYILLFFGFTTCPEACPMAMQKVSSAIEIMGEAGKQVQPTFITIDPERDTPTILKDYIANFGDNIVGLIGTPEQTAAIAKEYGVYYAKRQLNGDYTMDHSTAFYLLAPDGSYVRPFRSDGDAKDLANEIADGIASSKS